MVDSQIDVSVQDGLPDERTEHFECMTYASRYDDLKETIVAIGETIV